MTKRPFLSELPFGRSDPEFGQGLCLLSGDLLRPIGDRRVLLWERTAAHEQRSEPEPRPEAGEPEVVSVPESGGRPLYQAGDLVASRELPASGPVPTESLGHRGGRVRPMAAESRSAKSSPAPV